MSILIRSIEEVSSKDVSEMKAFKVKNILNDLNKIKEIMQTPTIIYEHFLAHRGKMVFILNGIRKEFTEATRALTKINESYKKIAE